MFKTRNTLLKMYNLKDYWNSNHKSLNQNLVSIGDYTYGIPEVISWDDSTKVKIGKYCSLALNIYIMAGGEHRTDWVSTYPFNCLIDDFDNIKGHPATKGDIIIGNDVWIGDGVTIISGVSIGDGAVIGTRSVVTKNVPPYSIVAGNPARIIRYRFSEDIINELELIKWWDFDEKDIIKLVPFLQSNDMNSFLKRARKIYEKNKKTKKV